MANTSNILGSSSTPPSTSEAKAAQQRRRVYFASAIGSAIEFYDFLIYVTAASLVFAKVFFADATPFVATLASFGTLAVGYVARPLGGIIFGYFGDRVSRKSTLIWTLSIMGVATTLIGLIPTPAQIGVLAPILLVSLRIIQGLAVGGEWGGSVLMSVEHAKKETRGLLGSATQMGAAGGLLLSFAAFAALGGLSQEEFLAWGWRLPFLATFVLLGIGLWVRLSILESPVHEAEKAKWAAGEKPKAPLFTLLRDYPGRIVLGIGVYAGPFMAYVICTSLLVGHANAVYGIPRQLPLNALMIATAGMLVTIPLFGYISDKVGRRTIYIFAALLTAVHAFTVFPMVFTGSFGTILLAYVFSMTLLNAAAIGPIGALLAELYPTSLRYTGVSLSYQFSGVVGGLGPLIGAALLAPAAPAATQGTDAAVQAAAPVLVENSLGAILNAAFVTPTEPGVMKISIMISVMCVIAALCTWALGDTRKVDLTKI